MKPTRAAIYRIIFFHVPAAMDRLHVLLRGAALQHLVSDLKKFQGRRGSRRNATEVGVVLTPSSILVTGSIWGRNIWGIWWTWDYRITSMFVCFSALSGLPDHAPRNYRPHHNAARSPRSSPFSPSPTCRSSGFPSVGGVRSIPVRCWKPAVCRTIMCDGTVSTISRSRS